MAHNSKTVAGGCSAIDITLQADPAGSHFLWDNGLAGPDRPVTATGTYWVSYDTRCERHTDTFHVIHGFSGANFPEIKIHAACKNNANGMAWVQRLNGDNTVYTFTWRDSQNNPLSFTDTLSQVPSGNYQLRVNAGPGCDTTLFVFIPEEEHHAAFQADTLACMGDVLTFTNTSPAHFNTFFWSLGDNTVSSQPAPVHTYTASGIYRVMLVAEGGGLQRHGLRFRYYRSQDRELIFSERQDRALYGWLRRLHAAASGQQYLYGHGLGNG